MSTYWMERLPIHPFPLEILLFSVILAFTSKSSVVRLGGFPLIAGLAWVTIHYNYNRPRTTFYGVVGGGAFTYAVQYIDTVLLSQWTSEAEGPTSTLGGLRPVRASLSPSIRSWTERVRFGLYYTLDMRCSGTPWEVKNVPRFSRTDSGYVPCRAVFLVKTAGRLLCYLLFLDLCSLGEPDDTGVMFPLEQIPLLGRLHELSVEELTTRVFASIAFWMIIYCIIQASYCILAIGAVASGLTEVKVWRPLYGSLAVAWSVRRFWGCFWHQCVRQKLSGLSHFATYKTLRLRKGTFVARYLFLFLCFALSGVMHSFIDRVSGVPWKHIRAFQFFCMQAVGIMLEDMIQLFYRSTGQRKKSATQPERWQKLVGYSWVLLWLTWTTPTWSYPLAQPTDQGKMQILPYSFVKQFL